MPRHFGPGPVFEFEWLTATRRWQAYAIRSLFVGSLLIALLTIWGKEVPLHLSLNQAQALLASRLYYAVVGTQLALIFVVAPAATAGSICIDKARGTLAHMLVTDLTNTEIVLGKLAARLLPVLMFVGCTLPVVSLCTLLGGIDPVALSGAYAVTVGVAVLGCSLSLTLSIWARKTHEVLMSTYLIWIVWLLAGPIVSQLNWVVNGAVSMPNWVMDSQPFFLAFETYRPTSAFWWLTRVMMFLGGCLAISAGLLTLSIYRVRTVAAREASRGDERTRSRWGWMRSLEREWSGLVARLPGPSLDANPVLWREWHRSRPSRFSRRIWAVYIGGALFFTLVAISQEGWAAAGMRGFVSLWVNGFQVAIGLLLLSVGASTALAEERARGSLDILMTTPISTADIVWGKWLGTFRRVPWLAVLPTLLATSLALRSERWFDVFVLIAMILAYGAFITSLGLALATWVPRLGRAVALCVFIDVLITVGSFFLIIMLFVHSPQAERALIVSPFGGAAILSAEIAGHGPRRLHAGDPDPSLWNLIIDYHIEFLTLFAYVIAALVLLVATLKSFDRCLGRATPWPDWVPRSAGPWTPRVHEPASEAIP